MCQSVKKKNVNASNKMLSGREGGGGAFRGMEYSIQTSLKRGIKYTNIDAMYGERRSSKK